MVEHDNGTIRQVAWLETFPWLRIVRAFRLAIGVRALILCALGAIVMATGWWLFATILCTFPTKPEAATSWLEPYHRCPWKAITDQAVPEVPGAPFVPAAAGAPAGEAASPAAPLGRQYLRNVLQPECTDAGWRPHDAVGSPVRLLTKPARAALLSKDFGRRDLVCLILCGLWGVAVWALFGAAVCRTAAVQLAADEQLGWVAAMRFAWRKWPAYFSAPLLPVGGVLLAAIPVLVLGWILRIAGVGVLLGGILWPLVLLAGFVMALLLLGGLFGWPLMWGAISAEGTDSFDALSRSYAYTFQRPLCYLFYAAVAAVIGWLGWLLVQNFAAAVIWLSYWAAGWGCGKEQLNTLLHGGKDMSALARFGAGLIMFWAGCVRLVAVGYLFSYFWTASAAVYFLLRRDVDATEMDEVYLDADESEPAGELSPITADQAGAPVAGGEAVGPPRDSPPQETA